MKRIDNNQSLRNATHRNKVHYGTIEKEKIAELSLMEMKDISGGNQAKVQGCVPCFGVMKPKQ